MADTRQILGEQAISGRKRGRPEARTGVRAQRHVAEAERRFDRQREIVAQLVCDGHDTSSSKALLAIAAMLAERHREEPVGTPARGGSFVCFAS
jgi:hypothetical protein